jgi:hypothetical protein
VFVIATANALHTRIFEAVHAHLARSTQHVIKFVGPTVDGGEDQHVRDVVQETRSRTYVTGVAVADAAREKVVATFMVQEASVEDCPVAWHGARFHDWSVM